MPICWDSDKRARNLAVHGVDFEAANRFEWEGCLARASLSSARATGRTDPRLFALGLIDNRVHALVFSVDHARVEIVSLRKANKRETERWPSET